MDQEIKTHLDSFIQKNNWETAQYSITLSKDKKFGDYCTNLCFIYAKKLGKNPQEIASELIDYLTNNFNDFYKKVEFVKPGFINFFLNENLDWNLIQAILKQDSNYPEFEQRNESISVEYVSANPTGKLHLAHAYAAIFGTALVNVLRKIGYSVQTEYYINDAGNQIDKLALSVFIRYLNLYGKDVVLYDDCYHGPEIIECAKALKETCTLNEVPLNTSFNQDKILDQTVNEYIKSFAKDFMLKQIKHDLSLVDVYFDLWTSEKSLYKTNQVKNVLERLKQTKYVYEKDNAIWLQTTKFGDDKDRVLVKSDGSLTYLVPDIALHTNKLERGFDEYYNIWGMDHHSYIKRLQIALQILGYKKTFDVICIQVMKLVRNGEEVKFSKRIGNALTLTDLLENIGSDALKWMCSSAQTSTHKTIDVDEIIKKDNSNPLFYVEYAYTRAFNILNKIESFNEINDISNQTINEKAVNLVKELSIYKNVLLDVDKFKQTQPLTNYLYKLATLFHELYNDVNILKQENKTLKTIYLNIIKATGIVLKNGLSLIGIKAYEKM